MNLVGRLFGHLRVISEATRANPRVQRWHCQCACGELRVVAGNNLVSGNSKSCGCGHGIAISDPVTEEQLRKLLRYDPKTGLFTWLVANRNCVVGAVAGHYNPANGYVRVSLKKRSYYAQVLAWFYMTGYWPACEVDHKDLNKRNNIWANLREATRAQNNQNASKRAHNRSGYKGVVTKNGVSLATITVARKTIHLGTFSSLESAARAYDAAAKKHFGEFARLNFGGD